MSWFVIDTCVLVDASGQGVSQHAEASHRLLTHLRNDDRFILAVDSKGKILRQYSERICAPMFAHHWLEALQPSRIRAVSLNCIPKGPRVALLENRLHRGDFPLVEGALGSDKIIVTRDFPSFSEGIQDILRRRLGIYIYPAADMIEILFASDFERGS